MNYEFWNTSFLVEPNFYLGTIIFILISYLIGSINAAQILSKIGSKNLGKEGSKSFGATNAGRTYGAWAFIIVFLFDVFKTLITILILMELSKFSFFKYSNINLSSIFVTIGHVFPLFFNFKGGKGVAPSLGCVIALNWIIAIIALSIFGIVKLINGWTSWSSIFGVGTGVILIATAHWPMYSALPQLFFTWTFSWTIIPSSLIMGSLVIGKHWKNIKRMINKEDPWTNNKRGVFR